MPVFLVSYDLKRPGQNYPALSKALQAVGAKKILLSQWIVNSTQTASQLRTALKTYGDANDSFLVVEITASADWASASCIQAGASYLKQLRP